MFRTSLKRLVAIVSVLALAFCTNGHLLCASNDDSIDEKPVDVVFDESVPEESLQQQPAIDAYEHLMASDGFQVQGDGPDIYPDSFGGCFIDDNNQLNVQYVGDSLDYYTALFEGYSSVLLVPVKYSYNYLYELSNYFIEQNANVAEACVDVYNNQASVGVSKAANFNEEYGQLQELAKDISSADRIELVEQQLDPTASGMNSMDLLSELPVEVQQIEPDVSASELWGGDRISGNGVNLTLGSTGYYNGSPAIVTCGHGLRSGAILNYNNSRIGAVSFHRF